MRSWLNRLADLLKRRGNLTEAELFYREARSLIENKPAIPESAK